MTEFIIKIPASDSKDTTVKITGGNYTILHGEYDERQHWLPISCFIVVSHQEKERKQPQKQTHQPLKVFEFVRISEGCRNLFGNDLHLPQLPLPFRGWKKVTISNWKKLGKFKYPGWQKGKDKFPNSMSFDVKNKTDLIQFCDSTCKGRYCISKSSRISFELENDYVMAKIGYGTGD